MRSLSAMAAWLVDDDPRSRSQARIGLVSRAAVRLLRNRTGTIGLLIVSAMILVALAAPLLPLADPARQVLADRIQPPSSAHWFGTDTLGRDIFARVVFGARPTLAIAALVLALVVPFGILVGAAAGLYPAVDRLVMRVCDVFMAFPRLILAIAVAAALGPGLSTAVIAIAATGWPLYARVARAEAIVYRRAEFLLAAEALGASRLRLLFRHILPLCLPSAIVRAALDAASIILITSGLGFLGASVPPPQAEWGGMVADGRDVLFDAWWISTIPGIAILLFSFGFNLLGDALRDVADPRSR
ncbi:ABC transporter permease [Mesorhizobium sp. M0088]|uniref:ABC transporter permease n=1 Tax=Mesorhizobium sp. M0088 TaxID=2956873 RepID=UPI00333A3516